MITSIQPRIRLNRSFDERSHSYLGYSLQIDGQIDDQEQSFWVGIGKAAQLKHKLQIGIRVEGKAHPVVDPRMETVGYYKVSGLKVMSRTMPVPVADVPPWHEIPPELTEYRQRGHRRLSASTYQTRCSSCIWGCHMPVVITVDQWNPEVRRYREETFCYGPKSCLSYKPGATRKVPGRSGMSFEEEDWVDEEATSHRGPDE